jgi:hypothetical protein
MASHATALVDRNLPRHVPPTPRSGRAIAPAGYALAAAGRSLPGRLHQAVAFGRAPPN